VKKESALRASAKAIVGNLNCRAWEVRLYCDWLDVSHRGWELKVDLAALIEEIVVTPFADDWQCQAIIAMIKSSSFKDLKIRQSDHMRLPENAWPSSQTSNGEPLVGIVGTAIASLLSGLKDIHEEIPTRTRDFKPPHNSDARKGPHEHES
jgi:hypothetical protein